MSSRRPRDGASSPGSLELGRVRGAVRRLLLRLGADTELAEDIASDVVLKLLQRAEGGRLPRRLPSYAFKAAWNRLAEVRRRRPSVDLVVEPVCGAGRAPIELREWLDWGLSRLAVEDRLLLHLRYEEELPVAEIASILGVPAGTAKWRLHEARRRLERELRRLDGGSGPAALALWPLLPGDRALASAGGTKAAIAAAAVLLAAVAIAPLAPAPGDGVGPTALSVSAARLSDGPRPRVADAPLDPTEPVAVREREASGLLVRVVGEDGHAIPGARWSLHERSGRLPPVRRGRADEHGAIRLRRGARRLRLLVAAPRHAPRLLDLASAGAAAEVVLARGWELAGRVTGASGRPLAEARVAYLTSLDGIRWRREARTDGGGCFEIPGLPEEPAVSTRRGSSVRVVAPDHAERLESAAWSVPDPEAPAGAPRRLLDLHVSRGAAISGRVVARGGGAAIAGAAVEVWSLQSELLEASLSDIAPPARRVASSPTADDGRFHVRGVPVAADGIRTGSLWHAGAARETEPVLVVVRAPGRAPHVEVLEPLRAGEVRGRDFELDRAACVRGRVVDEDGTPVSGAGVVALTASAPRPLVVEGLEDAVPERWWTRSDAEGRYELAGVPLRAESEPVRVETQWRGRPLGAAAVVRARAGDVVTAPRLVVNGSRTAVLRGRVTLADGRPCRAGRAVAWAASALRGGVCSEVPIADDGRFVLAVPRLWDRRWTALAVHAPGAATARLTWPDDPGRELDVRLRREAGLRGRVLLADGTPAAGARVLARPAPWPPAPGARQGLAAAGETWCQAAITERDGAFELTGLEPCDQHLWAWIPTTLGRGRAAIGAAGVRADVVRGPVAARSHVTLVIPDASGARPAALRVAVRASCSARPMRGPLAAHLQRTDGRLVRRVATAVHIGPGRLVFVDVPAGTYELLANGPGFPTLRRAGVRLAPGASVSLTLDVPEGVDLDCRVDAAALAAKPARVCVLARSAAAGRDGLVAPSGGDGRCRLRRLRPGSWHLLARGIDEEGRVTGVSDVRAVEVPADGPPPGVTLPLREAVTLRVRLTGAAEVPDVDDRLRRSCLVVRDAEGRDRHRFPAASVLCNRCGSDLVADLALPAGRYTVGLAPRGDGGGRPPGRAPGMPGAGGTLRAARAPGAIDLVPCW